MAKLQVLNMKLPTLCLVADVGADFGVVILSRGNGFSPSCSRILLKKKNCHKDT